MRNYKDEAGVRWGNTNAYREHEHKTKDYTRAKWSSVNDGLMQIFAEISICKGNGASADSTEVQTLIKKLQAYITANYYTCTNEILAGLGQMYVCDERFKNNINKYGDGVAEFTGNAIEVFCR